GEPDWSSLPRATPAPIRRLLARCLEKDSRRRPDAAEVSREIQEAIEPRRGAAGGRRLLAPALGVLVVGTVVTLLFIRKAPPPAPTLTQLTLAEGLEQSPAWAPDGQSIAYTAERGGVRKIFTRRLAGGDGIALTSGAFDDIQPAWSADGKTIAFVRARETGKRLEPGDVFGQYDGGDVWAVDVATRKEARLLDGDFHPPFSPDR